MAEEGKEKLRGSIPMEHLLGYQPMKREHTMELQSKVLELSKRRLELDKTVLAPETDKGAREKAVNERMELDAKVLGLQGQMTVAGEKDDAAQRDHLKKFLEAQNALSEGRDLGENIYDKEQRELMALESKVNIDDVFHDAAMGNEPQGAHMELNAAYRDLFNVGKSNANFDFAGLVPKARQMVPLALFTTMEERQKVYKDAAANVFAFQSTGQSEFSPDTAGNVRQKAIVRLLFYPGVIEFCMPDMRSVANGRVNIIIERQTDPANSAPQDVDEKANTNPYALEYFSKTMTLKRIQGIMEYTEETELLTPGVGRSIRMFLRDQLRETLQRYWLYGNEADKHEGLFRAAATATVNSVAARAAADRIGSTPEIDLSGALTISNATRFSTSEVTGGGGGHVRDFKHALTRKDVRVLLAGEVCNKLAGIQSMATDADGEEVLMRKIGALMGTGLIPDAVDTAPTSNFSLYNGNGFHEDDQTYGFGFRGVDPMGVGDIAVFPAVEMRTNDIEKEEYAIRRLTARAFVSIYAGVRPESCFKYVVKTRT